MSEPDMLSVQQLTALYQLCKQLRDAASYNKFRHEHAITESLWSQFCKQIAAVEHRVKETNYVET